MPRIVSALLIVMLSVSTSSVLAQQVGSHSPIDGFVEQASELSSRARANVYFPNPQGIFRGVQVNFVNVGTGNITFLRRDLVAPGRVPLVFARVYDSTSKGNVDFGPGWTLSAAESITIKGHRAQLFNENGSTTEFVETGKKGFRLERDYPSDYESLIFVDQNTLEAKLRTGFTKEFQLVANVFRLVKVTDHNGNDVRLSYTSGLLTKIANLNHSIQIQRNQKGRIIAAQDDLGRKVQFAYDEKDRLSEAKDLSGKSWSYSYSAGGKLTEALDPLKRSNFTILFDESGRVRKLQLPSGVFQFDFDPATDITTVTDARNLVSRFFQNEDGITVRVMNPLGEETAIRLDQFRNVISLSRDGSVIEKMEYDSLHRLTVRRTAADTGTIERQYLYDPITGFLSAIYSSTGTTQSFTYDRDGNLAHAVLPDAKRKFKFSPSGDLLFFSENDRYLSFSSDSDGLFASMSDGQNSVMKMGYKAGGQLKSVTFPGGSQGTFEYQPSGLRTAFSLTDGRHAEYSYDPAGNLTESKVFGKDGKQSSGQKLNMSQTYQLTRRTLYDGTITEYKYDGNGNLVEIKEASAVTRFEYDFLNRLSAVITPGGKRLTYTYKSGERSLIEQHQHATTLLADLRDTGLTFSEQLDVTSTRPLTGLIGVVRFSESLIAFQLSGSDGSEIIRPHERILAALKKLFLFDSSVSSRGLLSGFNVPFNTMFMPAEYASINCCPECYFDGDEWYCPPCFPPLAPVPTDSRITLTVFDSVLLKGDPPCAPNFGGWVRIVHKIVTDQGDADIADSGAVLTETVSMSTPNDLVLTDITVGAGATNDVGEFQDTYFACSFLCPGSTGTTKGIQNIVDTDLLAGFPFVFPLRPVSISYSCTGITANGQ